MIYIGNNEINGIYLGDSEISAIYAGETQIYPIGYFINYTSTDNQVINVPVSGWGTNVTVVNNTYTNGKGKIELSAQPTAIPASAFYNSNLASIRINSSITTIGGSAFGACTGLTEIDIKNVSTMGDAAFVDCGNLTAITMENISSIPYQCFYGCGFTEFTVGDNVTSIGQSAFESCTSLTTLTIGAGVTEIESSAFANCESLNLILAYPDTAPTIYADTFYGVAIGGVLKNNGGYEDWLSTDEAYLGYYEWTEESLINYIDYLTFTGASYVDTGILPDINTRVEMYGVYISGQQTYFPLFGGCNNDNSGNWFRVRTETSALYLNGAIGNTRENLTVSYPINGTIILDNTGLQYNNQKLSLNPTSMNTSTSNIYIHTDNRNGRPTDTRTTTMRVSEFKIFKNNVLVSDLKPAIDEDNVICFYDTINKIYKYNIGSGGLING